MNQTFIFAGNTEVGSQLSNLLVEKGFFAAPDVQSADVVVTYHQNQSTLEELYYGESGLFSETKEGAIFVDLSPTTPAFAQELNALAAVNNRFSLDAPLVVCDMVDQKPFAHADNLLIVAGGSADTYAKVEQLLGALASRVSLMGASGAGQAAKIALTLHNAAAVVGLIEADSFRVLSGELFDAVALQNLALEVHCVSPVHAEFIQALTNESYKGEYTVEIMMAELTAALSAADDKEMVYPQAEAGFHLLELLAVVGGSLLSPAALALVFASEEQAKKYGLDWARAEQVYEHHHDDECCGGHHDDPNHECCGAHDHSSHSDDESDEYYGYEDSRFDEEASFIEEDDSYFDEEYPDRS